MVFAIIAPEIMVLWAARQYQAAKYLAERHKERGWTMAHGFFLIMGGFTLHDNGTALRILEYSELETLFEAGQITWPSITAKEIQDRSKGDYLSKGIVVMHLGWFMTQFIARFAYPHQLAITELEILTVAFTILTTATYFLWWHKPLDVHCSVPVYLLENENIVSEGILSGSPVANPLSNLAHPGTSCESIEDLKSTQDVAFQFPINEESQFLQQPLIVSELDPDSSPRPGPTPSNAIPPPPYNNPTATPNSVFLTLLHWFVASMRRTLMFPVTTLICAFFDMILSHELDHSVPLSVPTFYCPNLFNDTTSESQVDYPETTALISRLRLPLMGAFVFEMAISLASRTSQSAVTPAWRISVVISSTIWMFCNLFGTKILAYYEGSPEIRKSWFWGGLFVPVMVPVLTLIFIITRITYFVLACTELRELTPAELTGIQWTSFVPHIRVGQ